MVLEENLPILEEVNLKQFHDAGYQGDNIVICLLDDGGIAREHMEPYYENILHRDDDTGHSTNVGYSAFTASPKVKIIALDAKRDFDEVYAWLDKHRDEYDIINISLAGIGGSTTPKYEKLKNLNKIILAASGNDGYDDKISYPANYDHVIAIGAWRWNFDNEDGGYVHGYSNGSENLVAVAPSGIYMLRDDGYVWSVQGTSFASPFACGMLACWLEWREKHGLPIPTHKEAEEFIIENCKDVEDDGFDYESGNGLFCMPDVEDLKSYLPEPEPTPPTNIFYRVVTGSFTSRDNAQKRSDDIKANGFNSFLIAESIDNKIYFRVITGSFNNRDNAEQRISELRKVGFDSFIAIYKK